MRKKSKEQRKPLEQPGEEQGRVAILKEESENRQGPKKGVKKAQGKKKERIKTRVHRYTNLTVKKAPGGHLHYAMEASGSCTRRGASFLRIVFSKIEVNRAKNRPGPEEKVFPPLSALASG